MRGKNKSLLEDIVILFICGVLVYFTYSYFFPTSEDTIEEITEVVQQNNPIVAENKAETTPVEVAKKEETILPKIEERALEEKVIENRTIMENKVETKTQEPVKKEEVVLPKVEEKAIEKPKVTPLVENVVTQPVIPTVTPVEKKVEEKVIEKPVIIEQQTKELEEKAKVDAFYKTIKEQVLNNIRKNIDSTSIKQGEFVNIRLTILKDGRYEHLTFIEGNKDYFELIKPSLSQTFPVIIDDSLKANFPRYFRMKIEF